MNQPGSHVALKDALRAMRQHPGTLLRAWNWKSAAFSAILRGVMFFLLNRHVGRAIAEKAAMVEFLYAIAAAGLAGAATQRLRYARPKAKTALLMFLVIPLIMLAAQAAVHGVTGTPRLRSGLIASFVFASVATGFNWFVMSRGIFITGGTQSFLQDLMQLLCLLPSAFVRTGKMYEARAKHETEQRRISS